MKKQKAVINQEMVEQQANELKQLAQQVSQLQVEIENSDALSAKHGKISLDLALKAGGFLRDAKRLVPRGDWETWLKENVQSITLRTAQNYMRLSEKVAIEEKGKNLESNTKHVSFLEDVQGLREAYLVAGIIKKPSTKTQSDTTTPETMKRTDKQKYNQLLAEAHLQMIARVRNELKGEPRINWDLSKWTIVNDRPQFGGEFVNNMFNKLFVWVSFRNFTSLTEEDEVRHKTGVLVSEVFKTLILANSPATAEIKQSEVFSLEINPKTNSFVEDVDKIAA